MSEPPDQNGPDHRATSRRRALLAGKLVFGAAEMTLDCAISDLSQTGARVRIAGSEPLIEPIYLINMSHGLAFKARQVWRRGALAGLTFSEYYDLEAPPPELPKRLRQLWVERIR